MLENQGRFLRSCKNFAVVEYTSVYIFSLLLRFIHDRFDDELGLTIGVDFKTKTVMVDGQAVKLAIWVGINQSAFDHVGSLF